MSTPPTAFTTNPGEILVVTLLFIGLIPLLRLWRRKTRATYFFAAYTFLFFGAAASVLESFALATALNYVEHVSTVVAAGLLLYYMKYTEEEVASL